MRPLDVESDLRDSVAPAADAPPPDADADSGRPRRRTIGLAVALALVCLTAAALTAFVSVKGGFRGALTALLPPPDLRQVFGKDRLRIMIMGLDDNWTDSDEVYTSNSRTDTNIAVAI